MPNKDCCNEQEPVEKAPSFWGCVLGFERWNDYFADRGINVPHGLVFRWGQETPPQPADYCPCSSSDSESCDEEPPPPPTPSKVIIIRETHSDSDSDSHVRETSTSTTYPRRPSRRDSLYHPRDNSHRERRVSVVADRKNRNSVYEMDLNRRRHPESYRTPRHIRDERKSVEEYDGPRRRHPEQNREPRHMRDYSDADVFREGRPETYRYPRHDRDVRGSRRDDDDWRTGRPEQYRVPRVARDMSRERRIEYTDRADRRRSSVVRTRSQVHPDRRSVLVEPERRKSKIKVEVVDLADLPPAQTDPPNEQVVVLVKDDKQTVGHVRSVNDPTTRFFSGANPPGSRSVTQVYHSSCGSRYSSCGSGDSCGAPIRGVRRQHKHPERKRRKRSRESRGSSVESRCQKHRRHRRSGVPEKDPCGGPCAESSCRKPARKPCGGPCAEVYHKVQPKKTTGGKGCSACAAGIGHRCNAICNTALWKGPDTRKNSARERSNSKNDSRRRSDGGSRRRSSDRTNERRQRSSSRSERRRSESGNRSRRESRSSERQRDRRRRSSGSGDKRDSRNSGRRMSEPGAQMRRKESRHEPKSASRRGSKSREVNRPKEKSPRESRRQSSDRKPESASRRGSKSGEVNRPKEKSSKESRRRSSGSKEKPKREPDRSPKRGGSSDSKKKNKKKPDKKPSKTSSKKKYASRKRAGGSANRGKKSKKTSSKASQRQSSDSENKPRRRSSSSSRRGSSSEMDNGTKNKPGKQPRKGGSDTKNKSRKGASGGGNNPDEKPGKQSRRRSSDTNEKPRKGSDSSPGRRNSSGGGNNPDEKPGKQARRRSSDSNPRSRSGSGSSSSRASSSEGPNNSKEKKPRRGSSSSNDGVNENTRRRSSTGTSSPSSATSRSSQENSAQQVPKKGSKKPPPRRGSPKKASKKGREPQSPMEVPIEDAPPAPKSSLHKEPSRGKGKGKGKRKTSKVRIDETHHATTTHHRSSSLYSNPANKIKKSGRNQSQDTTSILKTPSNEYLGDADAYSVASSTSNIFIETENVKKQPKETKKSSVQTLHRANPSNLQSQTSEESVVSGKPKKGKRRSFLRRFSLKVGSTKSSKNEKNTSHIRTPEASTSKDDNVQSQLAKHKEDVYETPQRDNEDKWDKKIEQALLEAHDPRSVSRLSKKDQHVRNSLLNVSIPEKQFSCAPAFTNACDNTTCGILSVHDMTGADPWRVVALSPSISSASSGLTPYYSTDSNACCAVNGGKTRQLDNGLSVVTERSDDDSVPVKNRSSPLTQIRASLGENTAVVPPRTALIENLSQDIADLKQEIKHLSGNKRATSTQFLDGYSSMSSFAPTMSQNSQQLLALTNQTSQAFNRSDNTLSDDVRNSFYEQKPSRDVPSLQSNSALNEGVRAAPWRSYETLLGSRKNTASTHTADTVNSYGETNRRDDSLRSLLAPNYRREDNTSIEDCRRHDSPVLVDGVRSSKLGDLTNGGPLQRSMTNGKATQSSDLFRFKTGSLSSSSHSSENARERKLMAAIPSSELKAYTYDKNSGEELCPRMGVSVASNSFAFHKNSIGELRPRMGLSVASKYYLDSDSNSNQPEYDRQLMADCDPATKEFASYVYNQRNTHDERRRRERRLDDPTDTISDEKIYQSLSYRRSMIKGTSSNGLQYDGVGSAAVITRSRSSYDPYSEDRILHNKLSYDSSSTVSSPPSRFPYDPYNSDFTNMLNSEQALPTGVYPSDPCFQFNQLDKPGPLAYYKPPGDVSDYESDQRTTEEFEHAKLSKHIAFSAAGAAGHTLFEQESFLDENEPKIGAKRKYPFSPAKECAHPLEYGDDTQLNPTNVRGRSLARKSQRDERASESCDEELRDSWSTIIHPENENPWLNEMKTDKDKADTRKKESKKDSRWRIFSFGSNKSSKASIKGSNRSLFENLDGEGKESRRGSSGRHHPPNRLARKLSCGLWRRRSSDGGPYGAPPTDPAERDRSADRKSSGKGGCFR